MTGPLAAARAVADAVLYEGYLLYPYRASSGKNRLRWQWGTLGPPGLPSDVAEDPAIGAGVLLLPDPDGAGPTLTVRLRFLHLQHRQARHAGADVAEVTVGDVRWLTWDEAVPVESTFGPFAVADLAAGVALAVDVPAGTDLEPLGAGAALERRRLPLAALLTVEAEPDGAATRVQVAVRNVAQLAADVDRQTALACSLLGTHLLLEAAGGRFASRCDPPPGTTDAAARLHDHRSWPVLAGPGDDVVLVSPIILDDHPALAPESAGALFDATEIDEILTLRVLTMTDDEKAEARATDSHAAAIVDRCEAMSTAELQLLHGALRNPHAGGGDRFPDGDPLPGVPTYAVPAAGDDLPWWDPGVDGAVDPEGATVGIDGVQVGRGHRVVVRPRRRADAQDIFFAGRVATVAAVQRDVDGGCHVAVVLVDDPAADLHEWYGRYLYFAPDELVLLAEPAPPAAPTVDVVSAVDTQHPGGGSPWPSSVG